MAVDKRKQGRQQAQLSTVASDQGPQQPAETKRQGIRHLIDCTCILPQYLKRNPPVFHKFTVFSELDNDSNVIEKYAQCTNCGTIHRITDICKSEIYHGRDTSVSVMTVNELSYSLPTHIVNLLQEYKSDVSIWENAKFIIDNAYWGDYIVLSSEEIDGKRSGKFVVFMSETRIAIQPFNEASEFKTLD